MPELPITLRLLDSAQAERDTRQVVAHIPDAGPIAYTLFGDTGTPDPNGKRIERSNIVTVGVVLNVALAGTITHIRFRKAIRDNTTARQVALWEGTSLIGRGVSRGEPAGGQWIDIPLNNPVPVQPGGTYLPAVFSRWGWVTVLSRPQHQRSFRNGYTAGPLSVPSNGGRYTLGDDRPNIAPSGNAHGDNYHVDVVFVA